MSVKIAINGFGRIGRLAFRELENFGHLEVVAVNDLTDAATLAHLLKYDSAYGRFQGTVEVNETNSSFIVNGREVQVFAEKDPARLPWSDLGVGLVIEATGAYKDFEGAGKHLEAGAKKVVVTAPGSDDMKMIVHGINNDILEPSDQIVSTASCTTNCLAPLAAALEDEYGIQSGLMTTIHAYTGDQNLQDGPHKKLTRARAAAYNIVPTSTGAAKAIGKVIPSLSGKLDGAAQRVPVITGSLTELTVTLEKKTSVEEINALMKSRANESFAYVEDPIVSADVIGERYGSVFDATQTKVLDTGDQQLVQVAAWYDNEMGYVSQMIRTIKQLAEMM